MDKKLHILLKFPNDKSLVVNGVHTDTIEEHKNLCEAKNRLIWGQGSGRSNSAIQKKNRDRILKQVNNLDETYSFFLANNEGSRELYVGKINNLYDKGELSQNSLETQYIPSYYSETVGTSSDINNLFVDVSTFFRVSSDYLDNITLESNGKKILSIKNSSSVFLVNIDDKLESLLLELLNDSEENFQYQVEQEMLSEEDEQSESLEDRPMEKPSKTSNGKTYSYKRNTKVSKKAIRHADYICEFDSSHRAFTSRVTNKNYVEAHHLVPMEYQDKFEVSLDVEANIVSLCPSCHKKLHHATFSEKEPLLKQLYDARKTRLESCGVEIEENDLLDYYDK